MFQSSKGLICSVATALAAIVAPFLLAASAVVLGIGCYLVFRPGPSGREAGPSTGWDALAPSWPLIVVAVLLAVIGIFTFRHMGGRSMSK